MARFARKPDRLAELRGHAFVAALLFAILLFGGASRADAMTQAIVRVLAIVAIATTLWNSDRNWSLSATIWVLFGAWTMAMAIQLVPLPPALWSTLPGHELLMDYYAATSQPLPWHPLSMVPEATANALFAMVVVWGALAIQGRRLHASPTVVEFVLLAFLFLSLAIGVIQFVSGGHSLYFYAITNLGSPVGLFSNRNHNAFMLTLIVPLMTSAVLRGCSGKALTPATVGAIAVVALAVMVNILVIGSRMGIVLFALAVAGSVALMTPHIPRRRERGRRARGNIALFVGAGASALIVGLVAVGLVYADRFTALTRATHTSFEEERFAYVPSIVELIREFFPFGSGFGTFPMMFKVVEPDELLTLAYLNHAHNDLLEIAVEGGFLAIALVAVFLVAWLIRTIAVWRGPSGDASTEWITQARVGSIVSGTLLVGSLTDYPLRTPACAVAFAIACCWLFAPKSDGFPRNSN